MWRGTVVSLHVAPEASAPMQTVTAVRAVPGRGLEGDRYFAARGFYSAKPSYGGREVTLVETEAIEALRTGVTDAEGHRLAIEIAAADTRRNIATSGVPLNHLVDRDFWVGEVWLRGTRLCEPCRHLEDLTKRGVLGGLVHRGGLRARILTGGTIRAGDVVRPYGA